MSSTIRKSNQTQIGPTVFWNPSQK